MKQKLKKLPNFKNEDEERDFWTSHSPLDYFDNSKWVRVRFPNLKPTTQPISLRLPISMISELKVKANRIDIPYQALIKQAIAKELANQ